MCIREVAENRRNAQDALAIDLFARGHLSAGESHFDSAARGAAVTIDAVAVVTLLVDQQAITAVRRAGEPLAVRLTKAQRRAAVEGQLIAVITGLGPLPHAVTTNGVRADTGLAIAFTA